ncbi:hypothetical protein FA09DRAFT_341853 [Tilletiopsis washingtonensis]|jgi:hypothetical protein|uniref:Glycine zipper domain-containing protein n=1 Tax=Tilletiopsis washingtonensis TaxID=58919 RepID=A0A316YZV2_9BASI|nr:hypothetical protein FA09DRAFT_341853 [Tilletiopsis washingtonensis]PWN94672.1 hypothetical protein FA09DRAFT_341853 [Tilletiopsis washingtonensis]
MQLSVAYVALALASLAAAAPIQQQRGFGDWVSQHANGLQDAAASAAGLGVAGPVGAIAGKHISDHLQGDRRAVLVEDDAGVRRWNPISEIKEHANGLTDIGAGIAGGVAGSPGGIGGVLGGATAGIALSDKLQGERRELFGERGTPMDWIEDNQDTIQDLAGIGIGAALGSAGGPVGAVGGAAAGAAVTNSIQDSFDNRRALDDRGVLDWMEEHRNGVQDATMGTIGGILGAPGGAAGVIGGAAAGAELSDKFQGERRMLRVAPEPRPYTTLPYVRPDGPRFHTHPVVARGVVEDLKQTAEGVAQAVDEHADDAAHAFLEQGRKAALAVADHLQARRAVTDEPGKKLIDDAHKALVEFAKHVKPVTLVA